MDRLNPQEGPSRLISLSEEFQLSSECFSDILFPFWSRIVFVLAHSDLLRKSPLRAGHTRRSSVWMCKLFYWSIVSTKWFSKSNTSPFLVLRDWVWLDILRPFGIGPASVCSSSFSSFFLLSIVLTLICWFTVLVLVSLLIFLQDAEHLLDALHQHLIVLGGKALRTGNEYPAETIRWLTRNYYFVNPPII